MVASAVFFPGSLHSTDCGTVKRSFSVLKMYPLEFLTTSEWVPILFAHKHEGSATFLAVVIHYSTNQGGGNAPRNGEMLLQIQSLHILLNTQFLLASFAAFDAVGKERQA